MPYVFVGHPTAPEPLPLPDMTTRLSDESVADVILERQVRENTEVNRHHPPATAAAATTSGDYFSIKPRRGIVRKKSGELLKPSLRSRPRSLPSTPTFKQVHFGNDLAVKYFDGSAQPSSVSGGTSPFASDEEVDDYTDNAPATACPTTATAKADGPQLVPVDDAIDLELPVFLLSMEPTANGLTGYVAVKNLAYEKDVSIIYTTDNWQTRSGSSAQWTHNAPIYLKHKGYERFKWCLHIFGEVDLCVRVRMGGCEYWDNNFGKNYNSIAGIPKKLKINTALDGLQLKERYQEHLNMARDDIEGIINKVKVKAKEKLRKSKRFEKMQKSFSTTDLVSLEDAIELNIRKPIEFDLNLDKAKLSKRRGANQIRQNVADSDLEGRSGKGEDSLADKNKDTQNSNEENSLADENKDTQDPTVGKVKTNGAHPHWFENRHAKVTTNSEQYKRLVERYCFFQTPNSLFSQDTGSSFFH